MKYRIKNEDKKWIEDVWRKIDTKLQRTSVKNRNIIPFLSLDGAYNDMVEKDITWWTNGFWGGLMWMMYEATGNKEYKLTAMRSEELLDEAFKEFEILQHDVGFIWHLVSGASYRLTEKRESKIRNFYAATMLASRYNIEGGYIRAWNGEQNEGWSIIDSMMNLSLLYWAAEELDAPRFKKIAMKHADMVLRDHIRKDGSVNHIVDHNPNTGEVVQTFGGQGYREGTCWTRGLAWAIYGMVISYIHTSKKEYLDAAVKSANYFIANCRSHGYKTVIDFKGPFEPMYYDSTAGVCAACGILEIAKYVSESESHMYMDEAINILKETDRAFCDYTDAEEAIVLNGSTRYPINGDMSEVHVPIIYGDFFYTEAILKLRGSEFFIW